MEQHFLDMLFLIENDPHGDYKFSFHEGLMNFVMTMSEPRQHSTFLHAMEPNPISVRSVYDRLANHLSKLEEYVDDTDRQVHGYYAPKAKLEPIAYHAFNFLLQLFSECVFLTPLPSSIGILPNKDYSHNTFNYFDDPSLQETHPGHQIFRPALFLLLRTCQGDNDLNNMLLNWRHEWPEPIITHANFCINALKKTSTLPNDVVSIKTADDYFFQPEVFRIMVNCVNLHTDDPHDKFVIDTMRRLILPWENSISRLSLIKNNVGATPITFSSAL